MITSTQVNKGQYDILEDGQSTGWTIERTQGGWNLLSFDDDIMDTFTTKREALAEYGAYN